MTTPQTKPSSNGVRSEGSQEDTGAVRDKGASRDKEASRDTGASRDKEASRDKGASRDTGASKDTGLPKEEEEEEQAANPNALFRDMVDRLVDRGVALPDMKQDDVEYDCEFVFALQRDMFGDLALRGLCWAEREGDIRVHVATGAGSGTAASISMPRVRLESNSARVRLQMGPLLSGWLRQEEAAWAEHSVRDRKLFLCRLHEHLLKNLRRLPYLCVHCLSERGSAYPRWRPSACQAEICQLRVRELSGDALSILAMAPQVVELELSLFAAACHPPDPRRRRPFLVNIEHFSEFLKEDPEKGANWKDITATLAKMPALITLPREPKPLERALRTRDPRLFKLVRWVVNSTPGFLVEVEDPWLRGLPKVFLFHPDNHEKLERFDVLRAAYGMPVAYAFHGSINSNWFTILRDGLVADGRGIFFGKDFSTSIPFCEDHRSSAKRSKRKSQASGTGYTATWRCIGLFEIAYFPDWEDRGRVYVVSHAERVLLRALLVFNHGERYAFEAAWLGRALERLPLYRELHALGPLAV